MIVFFEGVACAGKTSLIKRIRETSKKELFCIEELPNGYEISVDKNKFCMDNDENKCQSALKNTKNKIVLVDRGYLSTIVYNYIEYKFDISEEYFNTISWYFESIANRKLVKPDLYVYINLDKKTAIHRAKKLGRFAKGIAWFYGPKTANIYYKNFFKYFEPEIPILELSGNHQIDEMVKAFWVKIDELKKN